MSYRSSFCMHWLRQPLAHHPCSPTTTATSSSSSSPLWRLRKPSCALRCVSTNFSGASASAAVAVRTVPLFAARFCQTHAASPVETAAEAEAAGAASSSSSVSPPLRDRFVCPECGKRFLCAANLLQHRIARHGLHVVTAEETARAALIAANAELARELARLRALVMQLKGEEQPAVTTTTTTNPNTMTHNASADGASTMTKAYPSAVLTGQLMEVSAGLAREWQRSGLALGTGVSFVSCIGTVRGPVQVGTLAGAAAAAAASAASPRVVQFTLEAHGYRERRPGQLKMYRAHMLVRYIPSRPYHDKVIRSSTGETAAAAAALFAVDEGDVVRVQGHYGLHNSYDMVSKLPVENVVVEADFVGLLMRRRSSSSAGAVVPGMKIVESSSQCGPTVMHKEGEAAEERREGVEPAVAAALPAPPLTCSTTSTAFHSSTDLLNSALAPASTTTATTSDSRRTNSAAGTARPERRSGEKGQHARR
ncbi:putative mitochondrial unspecified product [Leptomonas pyrrhocoris]|uniref:Putative mitochondrial unspecified product n=1 Tax=Leptomonas pyrrhocoris TaxID=157538 RepID=A0A0M9FQG8_LEPPY|nr:putative mitochondrial unspecified product [Leptomonas pyrrhocoris]KPA73786.1 putative mitochondrial unspecified product [Leptomonas pyrrhocoris]|eukprot:XP_015652225.1 putative mitochondrial unspecified product [Leptomonas pyrrhocoris]